MHKETSAALGKTYQAEQIIPCQSTTLIKDLDEMQKEQG